VFRKRIGFRRWPWISSSILYLEAGGPYTPPYYTPPCCHAREVTLSFMDTLIALTYLLLWTQSPPTGAFYSEGIWWHIITWECFMPTGAPGQATQYVEGICSNSVTLKSRLEVTQNGTIRQIAYEFLLAFHSNWRYIVSFARYCELLVENREFFYTPLVFNAPE